MKLILILSLLTFRNYLFSQDSTQTQVTFQGFSEVYFGNDFNNKSKIDKDDFFYNYKNNNELRNNLTVLNASLTSPIIRSNVGLMIGDYSKYNLSAEPPWAQYIFEANIGLKPFKNKNIWIDAGILPSHIGFESAISTQCWALSRSLQAENSPYYETGLKVSFTNKLQNLDLALLALNGWQHIKKPSFLNRPTWGGQLVYRPNNFITINYSNFWGNEIYNSKPSNRIFHNFYLLYNTQKKISLMGGIDIGNQKISSQKFANWAAPIIMIKYALNKQISFATRYEYYSDINQVIINSNNSTGYKLSGVSGNIDWNLNKWIKIRCELKNLKSKTIPLNSNSYSKTSFLSSLAFQF